MPVHESSASTREGHLARPCDFQNTEGLEVVLKEVANKDVKVRAEAIEAIGDIGVDSEEVREVLRAALADINRRVKAVAEMTVRKLGIDLEEEAVKGKK